AATPDAARPARLDAHGDALPEGAVARLGTLRFRPEGYNGRSVLSPDGKVVALIGQLDDQLVFVDTATGKELRRVKTPHVRDSYLAYSPDGKYLATVQTGGGAQLYDAKTGTPVALLPRDDRASPRSVTFSPAFSADGQVLALCEAEGAGGGAIQTVS